MLQSSMQISRTPVFPSSLLSHEMWMILKEIDSSCSPRHASRIHGFDICQQCLLKSWMVWAHFPRAKGMFSPVRPWDLMNYQNNWNQSIIGLVTVSQCYHIVIRGYIPWHSLFLKFQSWIMWINSEISWVSIASQCKREREGRSVEHVRKRPQHTCVTNDIPTHLHMGGF